MRGGSPVTLPLMVVLPPMGVFRVWGAGRNVAAHKKMCQPHFDCSLVVIAARGAAGGGANVAAHKKKT